MSSFLAGTGIRYKNKRHPLFLLSMFVHVQVYCIHGFVFLFVQVYVYSCDYFRVVMCTCVNVYGYFSVCRYICVHMFCRFFLCTVVHVCMCLCGGKRGSFMCGSFSDFHLLFWDRFLTGLGLVPVEI